MKAALVVPQVAHDVSANLAGIINAIHQAAGQGADLVLFPEAVVTGLRNEDDPAHDLPLGDPIPGPVTMRLAEAARADSLYVAAGLLERNGDMLYDSAVLIAPDGEIALRYRRIDPHWHGPRADPSVYREGLDLPVAHTPLGSFAFVICGDLFDDDIVARVRQLKPDWLLFPFARCFDDGSYDQERWDREEKPVYAERVASAGAVTLMANYLADRAFDGGSFGGAMVVSGDGEVIAAYPLGRPGMLVLDLPLPSGFTDRQA